MAFTKDPNKGVKKAMQASQAMERWGQRKRRQGINWTLVDADKLRAAIDVVTSMGGAIQFGQLRGGVGIMVKVFVGDARSEEPAIITEELDDLMEDVIDDLASTAEDVRSIFGIPARYQQAAD